MGNPLLIALLVLILAPLVWFGAHYVVGRLVRPALLFEESARIAALPIVAVIGVALLAQWLQPVVWSLLRSAGVL
jgi:Kef-type K+ transport system membrane component KefB